MSGPLHATPEELRAYDAYRTRADAEAVASGPASTFDDWLEMRRRNVGEGLRLRREALHDAEPEGSLPACSTCGAGEFIITTYAPVYISVDSQGQVTSVRVDDEAMSVEGLPNRAGAGVSYVTCGGDDHAVGEPLASRVKAAADACQEWPGWSFGA